MSEDIAFFVAKSGRHSQHIHGVVGLIVPESSKAFPLCSFVYVESFKERMFRCESEGQKLKREEDAFFEEVERLRRGGEWRRVASER